MSLPKEVVKIIEAFGNVNADAQVIGGYVRDRFLGVESKDIDIEVFGISYDEVIKVAQKFGKTSLVGKSFGVVKLTTIENEYDISLPRRDSSVGVGHKDFNVEFSAEISPKEAASRRDFTINTISMSLDYIRDYFGGVEDLNNKILRHTSKAFTEDPLRVMRGFQFCGRFDLVSDPHTAHLCRHLLADFDSIPVERIWMEWSKWATKSVVPSAGLNFLNQTDWLVKFPEINDMIGVEQDLEWHPEGDVFEHTKLVCDAAVVIADREKLNNADRTVLLMAALCHDMGKPSTTKMIDGRIRARGHDAAGVPLAEKFLQSIGAPKGLIEQVKPLVAEHMTHCGANPSKPTVQRLSDRIRPSNIKMLTLLVEADMNGRPPRPCGLPTKMIELVKAAKQHNVFLRHPIRIIKADDIKHLVKPGPAMGVLLDLLYEKQLKAKFTEQTKDKALHIAKGIIFDPGFMRKVRDKTKSVGTH